jgi:hypothetical protein
MDALEKWDRGMDPSVHHPFVIKELTDEIETFTTKRASDYQRPPQVP